MKEFKIWLLSLIFFWLPIVPILYIDPITPGIPSKYSIPSELYISFFSGICLFAFMYACYILAKWFLNED
jgi:hypothetical protein